MARRLEPPYWGKRVLGLRVDLARADPEAVAHLVRAAWRNKAPRRLPAATMGTGRAPSARFAEASGREDT